MWMPDTGASFEMWMPSSTFYKSHRQAVTSVVNTLGTTMSSTPFLMSHSSIEAPDTLNDIQTSFPLTFTPLENEETTRFIGESYKTEPKVAVKNNGADWEFSFYGSNNSEPKEKSANFFGIRNSNKPLQTHGFNFLPPDDDNENIPPSKLKGTGSYFGNRKFSERSESPVFNFLPPSPDQDDHQDYYRSRNSGHTARNWKKNIRVPTVKSNVSFSPVGEFNQSFYKKVYNDGSTGNKQQTSVPKKTFKVPEAMNISNTPTKDDLNQQQPTVIVKNVGNEWRFIFNDQNNKNIEVSTNTKSSEQQTKSLTTSTNTQKSSSSSPFVFQATSRSGEGVKKSDNSHGLTARHRKKSSSDNVKSHGSGTKAQSHRPRTPEKSLGFGSVVKFQTTPFHHTTTPGNLQSITCMQEYSFYEQSFEELRFGDYKTCKSSPDQKLRSFGKEEKEDKNSEEKNSNEKLIENAVVRLSKVFEEVIDKKLSEFKEDYLEPKLKALQSEVTKEVVGLEHLQSSTDQLSARQNEHIATTDKTAETVKFMTINISALAAADSAKHYQLSGALDELTAELKEKLSCIQEETEHTKCKVEDLMSTASNLQQEIADIKTLQLEVRRIQDFNRSQKLSSSERLKEAVGKVQEAEEKLCQAESKFGIIFPARNITSKDVKSDTSSPSDDVNRSLECLSQVPLPPSIPTSPIHIIHNDDDNASPIISPIHSLQSPIILYDDDDPQQFNSSSPLSVDDYGTLNSQRMEEIFKKFESSSQSQVKQECTVEKEEFSEESQGSVSRCSSSHIDAIACSPVPSENTDSPDIVRVSSSSASSCGEWVQVDALSCILPGFMELQDLSGKGVETHNEDTSTRKK